LRHSFPGVKFSVRQDRGGYSRAIDIRWNAGPETEVVKDVVDAFKCGNFDGMTDGYRYSKNSWKAAFGVVE
jgi:hypothetical protein